VVWSRIETVSHLSEIRHPAVREGLRYLGFETGPGIEIHHQGDLPARSGMGSSSAFAVGLIKALLALKGQSISAPELARAATHLERDLLKESVGSQDQIASAHGGLNLIEFRRGGEVRVAPVRLAERRQEEWEAHLLLIYPGTARDGSELAAKAISNIPRQGEALHGLRGLVDQALDLLGSNRDIAEMGELLERTWRFKRQLNPEAASPLIDRLYGLGREAGALGGKVLGSGGAGFLLFFVPPEKQRSVLEALPGYLHVPFRFEREGCSLIQGEGEFEISVRSGGMPCETRPLLPQ
jgi:D-glycero-alpha-D-manno-heptose-7-phosphate kinase